MVKAWFFDFRQPKQLFVCYVVLLVLELLFPRGQSLLLSLGWLSGLLFIFPIVKLLLASFNEFLLGDAAVSFRAILYLFNDLD